VGGGGEIGGGGGGRLGQTDSVVWGKNRQYNSTLIITTIVFTLLF
jgi:hypothetical protein